MTRNNVFRADFFFRKKRKKNRRSKMQNGCAIWANPKPSFLRVSVSEIARGIADRISYRSQIGQKHTFLAKIWGNPEGKFFNSKKVEKIESRSCEKSVNCVHAPKLGNLKFYEKNSFARSQFFSGFFWLFGKTHFLRNEFLKMCVSLKHCSCSKKYKTHKK